jgi:hypothetical protein
VSKWSIAGAWVLVAALATTLTWQIVNAADAQVSDRPALQVDAPLAISPDSTSTTPPASTSTSGVGATSSSTTATTGPGASPSTPGSSPTSAATTAVAWSSRTIQTEGGVVVVSYRSGEVALSSASPEAGFAAEIRKQGPPEVDVEFESESAKYRVKARWDGADLAVEIDSDVDD